jgi:uncharacterized protein involved in copper resistance
MNKQSRSIPTPRKTTAGRRLLALVAFAIVAIVSACGAPAEPAQPAAKPETAAAKNAAAEAPHDDGDGHAHNPDGSHPGDDDHGHDHGPGAGHSHGKRTLSRTDASARVENFFEYEPLKAGQPGQFLLHLTDTSKGGPVANATVTVTARSAAGAEVATATAKAGKKPGIYSAELAIPAAGSYDLEFHVKTDAIDERIASKGIAVQ